MRPRRLMPVICAMTMLALSPPALAKGALGGTACGPGGCKAISPRSAEALLVSGSSMHPPPKRGVTILTVSVKAGVPGQTNRIVFDYAPGLGITHMREEHVVGWTKLSVSARGLVDAAVAGVARATPAARPAESGGPGWWLLAAAGLAGLALLGLLARYATRALNARPRAS